MLKFCLNSFLISRAVYIGITVIAFTFFDRYDKSNELIYNGEEGLVERLILEFFSNFNSYDSVHFIHLAKNNQTNDRNFAFFPLFPFIISYLAKGFELALRLFRLEVSNMNTLYLSAGFLLSNVLCFLNLITLDKYYILIKACYNVKHTSKENQVDDYFIFN
jgi:hypothetical protein